VSLVVGAMTHLSGRPPISRAPNITNHVRADAHITITSVCAAATRTGNLSRVRAPRDS
jgi:hypothetical protein